MGDFRGSAVLVLRNETMKKRFAKLQTEFSKMRFPYTSNVLDTSCNTEAMGQLCCIGAGYRTIPTCYVLMSCPSWLVEAYGELGLPRYLASITLCTQRGAIAQVPMVETAEKIEAQQMHMYEEEQM